MVFEQEGDQKWQAEDFEGRLEVLQESLRSGDCSLIISDVQFGDAGQYESFMVVDGTRSTKSRVFIQRVQLSVFGQSGSEASPVSGSSSASLCCFFFPVKLFFPSCLFSSSSLVSSLDSSHRPFVFFSCFRP